MFNLPVRTWILNAAAVFSGQHGAVTRQAEQAGCSRQTVYQHAHKLEQRLGDQPAADLPTDDRPRPEAVAAPAPAAGPRILLDKDKLRELATTAFAMGLSLRQIEDLIGVLLPADDVPDHSTLGHWVKPTRNAPGRSWRRWTRRVLPASARSLSTRSFLGATDPGRDRAGEHDGRLLPQHRRPQGPDLGRTTGAVLPAGVRRLRCRQGDR